MRQVGYLQRLYRDARSTEHKITENVYEERQIRCGMSVFRQNAVELMSRELTVTTEIELYWTSNSAYWWLPDIASNVSDCIKLVTKLISRYNFSSYKYLRITMSTRVLYWSSVSCSYWTPYTIFYSFHFDIFSIFWSHLRLSFSCTLLSSSLTL